MVGSGWGLAKMAGLGCCTAWVGAGRKLWDEAVGASRSVQPSQAEGAQEKGMPRETCSRGMCQSR